MYCRISGDSCAEGGHPSRKLPTKLVCCCRIRTERNGGAWCPKQPISRDTYEWLEIDLHQLKVVTQVETQGRFGYGQVPHLLFRLLIYLRIYSI